MTTPLDPDEKEPDLKNSRVIETRYMKKLNAKARYRIASDGRRYVTLEKVWTGKDITEIRKEAGVG